MTTEQTVRDIAVTVPGAVRVFEKYRIDYCCGGHRPLSEVCEERGIAVEALLEEVRKSGGDGHDAGRDWNQASLAELTGYIVSKHHAYLRAELPALRTRLGKVIEAHGKKYPEALLPLGDVFEGLEAELDAHLRKEEMILFPAIEAMESAAAAGRKPAPLPFGTVQHPISMMVFEHENAGHALAEMRRLTGNYTLPEDACPTFRALYQGLQEMEADLHAHIHLENNILFPRAVKLEAGASA